MTWTLFEIILVLCAMPILVAFTLTGVLFIFWVFCVLWELGVNAGRYAALWWTHKLPARKP